MIGHTNCTVCTITAKMAILAVTEKSSQSLVCRTIKFVYCKHDLDAIGVLFLCL